MEESTRRTRGVQRGPRSVQVVESVRAATLSELARVGFDGLTIDGVARAANVNRTTIYRRWPSRPALLAAVVEPLLTRFEAADLDTGSLGGDLVALLTTIRDNSTTPEGRALTRAVRSSPSDLLDLVESVTTRALTPFHRAADRAVARGETPRTATLSTAMHLAFTGVIMWEQTHDSPATDEDCERITGLLLAGLAATPPSP